MAKTINSRIPEGPVAEKWTNYKAHQRLVNPKNKLKLDIIVVGTGLAGASAAASLGEMGFRVLNFCIQDSPRRAHSIAAQGGINAAKNYQNDGDSVYRLFYDTVKGGDYRAREANVYRLAEVSNDIIDQCVAQGVPFAREYGGMLANRSFGGAQVSRTFYAKGQTGQQLLLGAYSSLSAQVHAGGAILSSLLPNIFTFKTGMIMSAAVFIGITLIGGLWSSGLSNIVSVTLIYVGIIYSATQSVANVGGWDAMVAKLPNAEIMASPYYWFAY